MRSSDEMYKLGASKTQSLPWVSVPCSPPQVTVVARSVRLAIQLLIYLDYRLCRRMPLAGAVRGHLNSVEWDRHRRVPFCP